MSRLATAILLAAVLGVGASAPATGDPPGVFVLGVDGMDPDILERLMDEGRVPNLAKLAREGSFQRLGTSNPPQSPVAWSNFVTGMDPGGHGIFDFIHRDPATYHPISSATPPAGEPGAALRAFGYVIPLSQPEMKNNRGGTPWWDVLAEHGVDVEVFRIPGNFPTPPSRARVLDGMGTVDLRGGFGTYTLYTETLPEKDDPKGDVELVSVQDRDLDGTPETVTSVLRGPPNTFRLEPGQLPGDGDYVSRGLTFHIDPESDTAVVEVGGQSLLLRQGEWSDWVAVAFEPLPLGLMAVEGTVRFYALELRPRFRVYASPVNLSPSNPAMPITSPDDFARELFEEVGFYYTQGLPEETDALKDGVFDDDDYLRQVALVQQDSRRMTERALDRFEPGDTTFVYLSDIDLQSHMLWRHGDPKDPNAPAHPAFEPEISPDHARDIENFYRDVDGTVGEIRARLPEGTLFIVMSDHGFQPYTREFHLNDWLRTAGYLKLQSGKSSGQIALDDVDWSKTRAYGIGFNGLYLNLKGREAQGIVEPADADALMDRIARRLESFRDRDTGQHVVLRVFRAEDAYAGERRGEGPDLIVGYNRGYGCSDESTLGEITGGLVLRDNRSRWSGNHLMAPEVVPGVLLVNRKLAADGHDLTDLTVTLLSHYGIEAQPGMIGESVL